MNVALKDRPWKDVTITLESEHELHILWHYLNKGCCTSWEEYKRSGNSGPVDCETMDKDIITDLWTELDKVYDRRKRCLREVT
jgi:hypothetical protein